MNDKTKAPTPIKLPFKEKPIGERVQILTDIIRRQDTEIRGLNMLVNRLLQHSHDTQGRPLVPAAHRDQLPPSQVEALLK